MRILQNFPTLQLVNNRKLLGIGAVLGLATLAFVLRLIAADYGYVTWDEGVYAYQTSLISSSYIPFRDFIPYGPTYEMILAVWTKIFGMSIFSARALTALFGSCTAVIVYGIGRKLGGLAVGLAAAAIYAISPSNIFWGIMVEHRQYVIMLSAAAVFLIIKGVQSRRQRYVVFAGLIAALSAWEYRPYAIFAVSGTVLVFLAAWLASPDLQSRTERIRTSLLACAPYVISGLAFSAGIFFALVWMTSLQWVNDIYFFGSGVTSLSTAAKGDSILGFINTWLVTLNKKAVVLTVLKERLFEVGLFSLLSGLLVARASKYIKIVALGVVLFAGLFLIVFIQKLSITPLPLDWGIYGEAYRFISFPTLATILGMVALLSIFSFSEFDRPFVHRGIWIVLWWIVTIPLLFLPFKHWGVTYTLNLSPALALGAGLALVALFRQTNGGHQSLEFLSWIRWVFVALCLIGVVSASIMMWGMLRTHIDRPFAQESITQAADLIKSQAVTKGDILTDAAFVALAAGRQLPNGFDNVLNYTSDVSKESPLAYDPRHILATVPELAEGLDSGKTEWVIDSGLIRAFLMKYPAMREAFTSHFSPAQNYGRLALWQWRPHAWDLNMRLEDVEVKAGEQVLILRPSKWPEGIAEGAGWITTSGATLVQDSYTAKTRVGGELKPNSVFFHPDTRQLQGTTTIHFFIHDFEYNLLKTQYGLSDGAVGPGKSSGVEYTIQFRRGEHEDWQTLLSKKIIQASWQETSFDVSTLRGSDIEFLLISEAVEKPNYGWLNVTFTLEDVLKLPNNTTPLPPPPQKLWNLAKRLDEVQVSIDELPLHYSSEGWENRKGEVLVGGSANMVKGETKWDQIIFHPDTTRECGATLIDFVISQCEYSNLRTAFALADGAVGDGKSEGVMYRVRVRVKGTDEYQTLLSSAVSTNDWQSQLIDLQEYQGRDIEFELESRSIGAPNFNWLQVTFELTQ